MRAGAAAGFKPESRTVHARSLPPLFEVKSSSRLFNQARIQAQIAMESSQLKH
jgi:hypothetical protein